MAGPWERYAAPAASKTAAPAPSGPWERYGAASARNGPDATAMPPTASPAPAGEWERATILPAAKNTATGEVELAWPQIAVDAYEAFSLPSDVYEGKVDPTSDEGMTRTLGLAGMAAGGAIARPSGSFVTGAGRAVPKSITSALRDDGIPIAEAGARVRAIGPDGVLADLGPNLRDKAAALATTPGQAQKTVVDAMTARKAAAPRRLTGALNETIGEALVPSYLQRSIRADQRALGPDYDAALAGAADVDTSSLAAGLQATIPTLRGKAQTEAQAVRAMLNRTGAEELDTSAATLFQIRRAIDGKLKDEADTNVRRVLGDARAQVDQILGDAVPGVKELDARYAELARQRDAVDRGQTVLGNGRTDPRPAELADEAAAGAIAAGEIVGPSGASFRLRQGARAEIDRIVGTNLNDRAALNSLLKGESDWNRQRLATLFGEDNTERLYRILDNERAMAETENKALVGSKTASMQAAQREVDGPPRRPGAVRSAANLKAGDAMSEILDAVFRGTGDARRAARNSEMADVLMGQGGFVDPGRMLPAPIGIPMSALIAAIMGEEQR